MSYTPEQSLYCANTWSSLTGIPVSFEYSDMWEVRYQDADGFDILIPLSGACDHFGLTPSSTADLGQDPVGWTFDNVNNVVTGVGGVFNNILGIFGLGSSQPTDYSDPNALDQAQSRQQMNLIFGFVAIVGLIMAGVYYSRKK